MYSFKIVLLSTVCVLSSINLNGQMELDSLHFTVNDKPENNRKGIDIAREMALWRKADSNNSYPQNLIKIGHALAEQRAFEGALYMYKKALFYTKIFNASYLPKLYFNIAHAYNGNEEYIHAMRHYAKALSYLQANDKKSAILRAKIHTNMAVILIAIPNYEKANFYLDKALPVFVQYKESVDVVVNLAQRALIYRQKKQHDSALALYSTLLEITEQAIQNKKEDFNLEHKTMFIWNIADLYGLKNDPDAALKVLNRIQNDMPR